MLLLIEENSFTCRIIIVLCTRLFIFIPNKKHCTVHKTICLPDNTGMWHAHHSLNVWAFHMWQENMSHLSLYRVDVSDISMNKSKIDELILTTILVASCNEYGRPLNYYYCVKNLIWNRNEHVGNLQVFSKLQINKNKCIFSTTSQKRYTILQLKNVLWSKYQPAKTPEINLKYVSPSTKSLLNKVACEFIEWKWMMPYLIPKNNIWTMWFG